VNLEVITRGSVENRAAHSLTSFVTISAVIFSRAGVLLMLVFRSKHSAFPSTTSDATVLGGTKKDSRDVVGLSTTAT
jgi:hypothetical protein